MNATDIKRILAQSNYNNVFIPEFTWGDLRIDSIMIDTQHRWIRGFEIKTSREDWIQDNKWIRYTAFCSSLCIVCPEDLIQPQEIEKPFGLIWVTDKPRFETSYLKVQYKKKPINFQKRNSLSWFYTYLRVLEVELRRMAFENVYKI